MSTVDVHMHTESNLLGVDPKTTGIKRHTLGPTGTRLHNYGTSPCYSWINALSMVHFPYQPEEPGKLPDQLPL